MLLGQMMDYPLTLTHFLERARTFFPSGQVVNFRKFTFLNPAELPVDCSQQSFWSPLTRDGNHTGCNYSGASWSVTLAN